MEQKFLDEFEGDFDFYKESMIEEDLENDEINSQEEGFMIGYLR